MNDTTDAKDQDTPTKDREDRADWVSPSLRYFRAGNAELAAGTETDFEAGLS